MSKKVFISNLAGILIPEGDKADHTLYTFMITDRLRRNSHFGGFSHCWLFREDEVFEVIETPT